MEFFRKGLEENITLPPPPTDDVAEAKEVKRIVAIRTAKDVKSVMDHDRVPFYAIRTYCDEHGLIFHDNEFKDVIYQATPIINYFKEKFNIHFRYAQIRYFISRANNYITFKCFWWW